MIKRIIFFALATAVGPSDFAQSKYFEGRVYYKYDFKSDRSADPEKLLSPFFGNGPILYFKEGNFRHDYEGGILEFDMYNRQENKVYMKKRNNDTIYWHDCGISGNRIENMMHSPKADTVLGLICDRLVIQYKDHSEIHYYNSDSLAINSDWFERFKLNDEYLIDRKEKSIYLKSEQIFDNFTLIETAIRISVEPVDIEKFKLPPNSVLVLEQ